MPTICPFCNSPVPMPQSLPADGRIACPRCEEMVTIHDGEVGEANAAPIETSAEPRLTNRMIAGLVVAVMLGMAALGVTFALQTVGIRRANDSKGAVPPEPAADVKPLPPAEWPGLGWMADDVQAEAGVRVADALESAAGRSLLTQIGMTDAGKTKILGLPMSAVDHLVFGASLRVLPPRVTAVIRTRGSIRDGSLTGRTSDQHGKSLVHGKLWANGPDGVLWKADRQTLVAALLPEDFDRVQAKPQAALVPDLMERLDPAALAWLVATVDANNPAIAIATPFLPATDRDVWNKLESLAVSIRADGPKLTLTLQLRGKDVAAGEAIAKAVEESLTKVGIAVERRAGSRERPEEWQKLTATADAEKLAGWLRPR